MKKRVRCTTATSGWSPGRKKVWTSLAHQADWCFVVCRTEPESVRHKGLSYLLVPMDQPGVEVRPITQLTRTSEFNEVFFDGARTRADNVVGERAAMCRFELADTVRAPLCRGQARDRSAASHCL